ncbi:hypothetical protein CEUSTIGMA_g5647.t1 [Chlamydomonas eustigma]|uniref:UBA domain-containing protein n=1 Tax=Chlamydomonas eustigma TaxID=1157962 RepID=A0A250X547_9CHLO|nr:hypothetical protein CEUSTIGMA_g5647.t1 [Chlamydomonas eustigma]|eukprot:GAX78205.1 hypothetical protein CEUSTIGMA_g5647.t1 [Chlamydomonas eustigma]
MLLEGSRLLLRNRRDKGKSYNVYFTHSSSLSLNSSICSAMSLIVRTLRGSIHVDVDENWTVGSLKDTLFHHHSTCLPERQNLVFRGRILKDGLLSESGVKPGSTLVLLPTTPLTKPSSTASTQAPTASEIRAVIVADARQRGLPIREEQHSSSSVSSTLLGMQPRSLADMDNQLMGLIEALEGRLGMLRQGELGVGAGEASDLSATAGPLEPRGAPEGAPAVAQADQAVIEPPEPAADHIQQLADMGFSETLARKALLLHRDRVPEAVEWLLQHGEDADADTPLTQEQLRRVYGSGGSGRGAGGLGSSSSMANAIRDLQMTLMQAVGGAGAGGDSSESGMESDGPVASGARDPLAIFRRRLQAQLGGGGDIPSGVNGGGGEGPNLSDLFPVEALMAFGEHSHEHNEDEEMHDEDHHEEEGGREYEHGEVVDEDEEQYEEEDEEMLDEDSHAEHRE